MRRIVQGAREIGGGYLESLKETLSAEPLQGSDDFAYSSVELESVDLFSSLEHEQSFTEASIQLNDRPWYSRLWIFLKREQTWLFLMILGICGALIILLLDFAIGLILEYKTAVVESIKVNAFVKGLIWTMLAIVLSIFSAAVAHVMSVHSAGSGIPEMKSVLSGMALEHYLSFRTFVAKCFGVVAALGSGLSVGKEGPYVHICAILAHQLARAPVFSRVFHSDALRLEMIGAGCAVAVATTFGAPLGGVLFSIEVTSTYYLIENLWKGFYCAVSGSLFVRLIGSMGLIALFSTTFDAQPYGAFELLSFSMLGIAMGFVAVFFIKFIIWADSLKSRFRVLSPEFRYVQVIVVAVITSLLSFPLVYLRNDYTVIMNDFFSEKSMSLMIGRNVILHLLVFIVVKLFLTGISVLLPIPCGVFTPVFLVGAGFGRILGEILFLIYPSIIRGGYAVVGAAAFSAAVTRSLSTSMIVFEVTGQLHHMMPVMISVILSCAIANLFVPSVYDALLKIKKLPHMPFYSSKLSHKSVRDIMIPLGEECPYLSTSCTFNIVADMLESKKRFQTYAVVDAEMRLVGVVKRSVLKQLVREKEEEYDEFLQTHVVPKIVSSPSRKKTLILHASDLAHEFLEEDDMKELLQEKRLFFNEIVEFAPQQIDYAPLQMAAATPVAKAYFIFSMLSPRYVYITDQGCLVGVLSKEFISNLMT